MAKIDLDPDQALVLFDLLSRFSDEDEVFEISHKSEEIVLWNICAMLEKQLVEPFKANYPDLFEAARDAVAET